MKAALGSDHRLEIKQQITRYQLWSAEVCYKVLRDCHGACGMAQRPIVASREKITEAAGKNASGRVRETKLIDLVYPYPRCSRARASSLNH